MKNLERIWKYKLLAIIGVSIMLEMGCEKDNNKPEIKYGIVIDNDFNQYKTVKIGTQVWMAENLRTTKYRNAESINNATEDSAWMKVNTGAYCSFEYGNEDPKIYGCYYNWYAINDSRSIAPVGWHVPTDAEWTTLINYLGGDTVAGLKIQVSGYSWWGSYGATNETGFTAVGTGFVGNTTGFLDGTILDIWGCTYWWSSTEFNTSDAWCRNLNYSDNNKVYRCNSPKGYGYSVRCIKD
jgi:uncharacterized protein (TIGR02145 family)